MMRPALLAIALCGCGAAFGAESARDCAAIADPAARLACYDEKHGKAAPAPAPAPAPANGFGLPPKPEPAEEIKSIKAYIVGGVKAWEKGTRFKLDNGQVWTVVSNESRYYQDVPDNTEVTIERNVFGAFWMDIPSIRARIKVKRVS